MENNNKKHNFNIVNSIGSNPVSVFTETTPHFVVIKDKQELATYNDARQKMEIKTSNLLLKRQDMKEGTENYKTTTNQINAFYKEFGEETENIIEISNIPLKNTISGLSVLLLDMDYNYLVSIVDDNGNKHPWFVAPRSVVFTMQDRTRSFLKNFTIVELLAKKHQNNSFEIKNQEIYEFYQATTETKKKKEIIRNTFFEDLQMFSNLKFVIGKVICHGKTFHIDNKFISIKNRKDYKTSYKITIDEDYYNWQKEKGQYSFNKNILKKDVNTSMFMLYCSILNIIDSNKDYSGFNYKFYTEQLKGLSFYRTDEDIKQNTFGKGVHGGTKDHWKEEFEKDLKKLGKFDNYSLLISEINNEGYITIMNCIDLKKDDAIKEFDSYCKTNNTKNPY